MVRLVEYINPKSHSIQIASPEKKIIKIKANEKVILPDWYMIYCPKYLRVIRILDEGQKILPKEIKKNQNQYVPERLRRKQKIIQRQQQQRKKVKRNKTTVTSSITKKSNLSAQIPNKIALLKRNRRQSPVVGRRTKEKGSKLFAIACQNNKYVISNNIGIGILSYNRLGSLKRLINSIRTHTDLRRTTIFVSDESSQLEVKLWLKSQTDIVSLTDQPRLGVAGNSNRLLKCLSRFKYGILLNDDVEILKDGWEQLYVNAHKNTKIHHFCYNQEGVYTATRKNGKITPIGSHKIHTIDQKPQGAVMFYTNELFNKIGYFDEQFGFYGIEHVDWSTRAYKSNMQAVGYHDIIGSEKFFKVHKEKSVVPSRSEELISSRKLYNTIKDNKNRTYINHSDKIKVPSISAIIPIRNFGRQGALEVVTNVIRGQLYPNIEIIIVEQDKKTNINIKSLEPCKYFLAKNKYTNQPFTKAMAFNTGVLNASFNKIILQDADIVIQSRYTKKISNLLDKHEGAHIGSKVLYMSTQSSNIIIEKHLVTTKNDCERAVEYFEGGSLACTRNAYFKVGGFNEIFEGYGIEDCDFFWRLKEFSKFFNTRTEDFIHLWHGRTKGWEINHKKNKRIFDQIKTKQKPAVYVTSLVAKIKRNHPQLAKELNL